MNHAQDFNVQKFSDFTNLKSKFLSFLVMEVVNNDLRKHCPFLVKCFLKIYFYIIQSIYNHINSFKDILQIIQNYSSDTSYEILKQTLNLYNLYLSYMILPTNHRKNKTLAFNLQDNYNYSIKLNRRSQTPQLRTNTSNNHFKKKRSPFKQENLKNMQISMKDASTIYQIDQLLNSQIPCKKCKDYQAYIQEISLRLKSSVEFRKQFQIKLQQLRSEYQKKIKKYKIKSKLQKDQLKLLKWVLSQRKDFEQIIQKFQESKAKNIQNESKNKENQIVLQISNDKAQTNNKRYLNDQQKTQPGTQRDHKIVKQIQAQKQSTNNRQDILFKNPSRQIILEQKVNILEQKLLELTMKNQFLETIKKKQGNLLQVTNFQNPISFSKEFNPKRYDYNEQSSNYQQRTYHGNDKRQKEEFIDNLLKKYINEQTMRRQALLGQRCWNFPSKNDKLIIQSRYASPLKSQSNSQYQFMYSSPNKKDSYDYERLVFQQQKNISQYSMQSRSKYMDSIKQRQKLLGI